MRLKALLLGSAVLCACDGQIRAPGGSVGAGSGAAGGDAAGSGAAGGGNAGTGGGGVSCDNTGDSPDGDAGNNPLMSPTRVLRRIKIALTGQAPLAADYAAILAASDDASREAIYSRAIDDALSSNAFYDAMLDFGRDWIGIPAIAAIADEPEYNGSQQINVAQCPTGTMFAGAWANYNPYRPNDPPCGGLEIDGSTAQVKQVEPWWGPGTMVTVAGFAANDAAVVTVNGQPVDCGALVSNTAAPVQCGCGPNLVYCQPSSVVGFANWPIYVVADPKSQRRLLWEEPARLIAHIAWNDRPLTDVIAGTYSVGPVELQAAYVRLGRRTGAVQLDSDDSWWRPSKLTGLTDPEHPMPGDPTAWREFQISARNPYLLADRNYTFDPRFQPRGSMRGVPAAGVLTMLGVLGSYTRERVRAARMLEAFAGEQFIPPSSDQTFNPYVSDPAKEGPCQVCHSRIDPSAIHFKRFTRVGTNINIDSGKYIMAMIGNWTYPDAWLTGAYPFDRDPWLHWGQWFAPGSKMTPVTAQEAMANPEARFIDYLPADQTLLGQVSDGTVGPLGFAKMIIAAGAFDRAAVLRLHARFGGRPIDPVAESGYLDALVTKFVAGHRAVRPFIRDLMKSDTFRRGL